MRKSLLTYLFLYCLLPAYPVYFKQIGTKDGLSQLSVMSICQDELGQMWLGTLEGISVYDGQQVTAFKPVAGSPDKTASEGGTGCIGNNNCPVVADGEGHVFFRSDGSLIRYDNRTGQWACLRNKGVHTVAAHGKEIWVATGDTIYKWDEAAALLRVFAPVAPHTGAIGKLLVDRRQQLWIGSSTGLYRIGKEGKQECIIPGENISDLMEDSWENLGIATRMNGMYLLCKGDAHPLHYQHLPHDSNSLSNNQVRAFAEDNYGNIWIGTFAGLDRLNPYTGHFTRYTNNGLPGSLSHASVFSLYKDRQGSIWVGTYYGGVNYFNPEKDIFTRYSESKGRDDCLSFPFVGHMIEDKEHNLWICTEGGGLNWLDRPHNKFTHFMCGEKGQGIAHNNVKSICFSPRRNKLYIGTHLGGLSVYDLSTKRFHNLYAHSAAYRQMAGHTVNQTALYGDRYLLLNTSNGVRKMDLDTQEVLPLFASGREYPASCFLVDSKGFVWIAQDNCLTRIRLDDESDRTVFDGPQAGLGDLGISCLFEDRDGRIFAGTYGAGLYCLDDAQGRFVARTAQKDRLQSNYCYAIAQSRQGYLIVSGDKGITWLDRQLRTVKTIDLVSGLPLSGINQGCGLLVCSNGEVFVGGIDGLVSFSEEELFAPDKPYKLYFSTLFVNNQRVLPGDDSGILHMSLPYTETVELSHRQNNLEWVFASNNYVHTLKKTRYEYKLEGFDDNWIATDRRTIAYTNLHPGKYTLSVREKSDDPHGRPPVARMQIVIASPWYATTGAYVSYVLVVTGIVYSIFRFKQSQLVLQTSLALERKEKEQIASLNQAKLQFFSNISHEFRTPLTLIISQIELLLQNTALPPAVYNKVLKIYKNTFHMRNLISELLDFRKFEQGHVTLRASRQNLVPFLREICLSFHEYATARSVTFRFSPASETIECWYDARQMQKVFFNLLSNAFKHSHPQGTIQLTVQEDSSHIVLKVTDDGTGISKEAVDKIFDRFYQAENSLSGTMPGTGIGLSLTKSIIELHHGTIQVESTPGYGSIFVIRLPKGRAHLSDHECATGVTGQPVVLPGSLPDPLYIAQLREMPENTASHSTETSRKILIVEDNEELLQILSSLFSPLYQIILARDGAEGWRKTRAEQPDLVLSDVMMPVLSGTEMCLKIKSNVETCHIPVVLLTALSSAEQNIEGLQRGADDYIGKPFHANVLLTRCNNLVRNRITLQQKFGRQENFDAQALATNPLDQKFLDTLHEIVQQNMDNEAFDISALARELGMSRSSLYTKFKSLTGMTPNDFVLTCRLNKAASLLRSQPHLQIADISDRLGFGSPRYFSRCFKARFDITPAEYRKKEDNAPSGLPS